MIEIVPCLETVSLPANWTASGFLHEKFRVETSDGHLCELLRPEPYRDIDGTIYLLPEKGSSDGGSVPPLLWGPPWNFPPFGPEWRCYYLHDGAFRNYLLKWNGETWANADLTEKQCNDLLWNALMLCGIDKHRAEKIITGVKVGGHHSFEEDREEQPV